MAMRQALSVGFAVALLLASIAREVLRELSAGNGDTEENLWPDPRQREGFRLETVRNAIRHYAGDHRGALPADLTTLTHWVPSDERRAMAHWIVDVWGTPILYEQGGPLFTLRSAGPDRAWRTADDVVLSGESR